jgi:hypothetical protein
MPNEGQPRAEKDSSQLCGQYFKRCTCLTKLIVITTDTTRIAQNHSNMNSFRKKQEE